MNKAITAMSRKHAIVRVLPVDKAGQQKSVARLLKFVRSQPERHYEGWTRDDLYE